MSWHEGVRQFWDPAATWWDAESSANWEKGGRSAIVPFLQKATKLPPGARVLDAGCGSGHGTIRLAQAGYSVMGVDLAPAMLKKARESAAAAALPSEFAEASLEALPVADGVLDGLMCVTALEFTEVPARALAEFRRALKPGGWAVMVLLGPLAPPRGTAFRRLYGERVVMNTLMPWELTRLLEEAGWQVKAQEGVYGPDVRAEWVTALAGNYARQACLSQLWMVAARS